LETKLKEEAAKLAEAEKNFQPDTSSKIEEAIEAESLKKSQEMDSALSKAITTVPSSGVPGVPGAPAAPTAPGFGQPSGAAPPIVPPGAPKAATPSSK